MRLLKNVAVVASILSIAAASGCTGTDVLSTGNVDFTISVEIVNPETRHDFALFAISAINVRPNGADADAALGTNPIGIIATQDDLINVDLNDLAQFDPTTIRLSTGSYRINRIEFSGLTFVDLGAPTPPADCTQLLSYPSLPPVAVTAVNLGDPNVTITEGGAGTLTITIDGAAMVEAFQNSFVSCNLNNSSATPNNFRPALFAAAAPTFVTFN